MGLDGTVTHKIIGLKESPPPSYLVVFYYVISENFIVGPSFNCICAGNFTNTYPFNLGRLSTDPRTETDYPTLYVDDLSINSHSGFTSLENNFFFSRRSKLFEIKVTLTVVTETARM